MTIELRECDMCRQTNPIFPCVADAHKLESEDTDQHRPEIHHASHRSQDELLLSLELCLHGYIYCLLFKRSPATMDSAVVCQNGVKKWTVDSN